MHPMPVAESAAQLVVGPLRGYRYWHAEWEDGQAVLRSVYHATVWPPQGPLHAACERHPSLLGIWLRRLALSPPPETHRAPCGTCECGVYALTRFDAIEPRDLLPAETGERTEDIFVLGVVLLWGRVVQHGHGYRAEYGRPVRLLTTPTLGRTGGIPSLLDAVATRYGIPLVTRIEELSVP